MFFVIAALSIVFLAVTAILYGRDTAIRWSLPLALLLPPWMLRHLGTASIDMRVVAFLAAAGIFLSQKGGLKLRLHFMLADALVLLLTASVAISLFSAGRGTVTSAVSILIQWPLPYLFGRLLGRTTGEVERLIPVFVLVLILLTGWAAFESIVKVNPLNAVLNRAGSFNSEFNYRWGLRRAEGPLTHPISFGMLLLLLIPWSLEAARRAKAGNLPSWLVALPVLAAVGVLFPISRGPILGLVGTMLAVAFLRFPKVSLPAVTAAVVLFTVVGSSGLIPMLEASAQEEAAGPLFVNGVEYNYTGTMHRLLLFPVFREALVTAGWFGFGSFDMSLPQYAQYVEPHLRTLFKSVDNCYIFLSLKHGYVSLALFVALGLTILVYAARLWRRDPKNLLAAGMLGGMASVMVVLLTVWFNFDFGFLYLLNAGLLAGWFSDAKRSGVRAASASLAAESEQPVVTNEKRTPGGRGRAKGMDEKRARRRQSLPRVVSGEPFDLAQVLRRHWVYLALTAVVCLPVALAVAMFLRTDLWVFKGTLALTPYRLGNTSYSPPDLSSLAAIIGSRKFAHDLAETGDTGLSTDAIESGTVARLIRGKPQVEVTFQALDREQSKKTLTAAMQASVAESQRLRDEEIDNLLAEYAEGLRLAEADVDAADRKLNEFRKQHGVYDATEERLLLLKDESTIRSGIHAYQTKREELTKREQLLAEEQSGESADEDEAVDAASVARLQMMYQFLRDEKQKEVDRIEWNKKKAELDSAKKLYEDGVMPLAEYRDLYFEEKLLRARVTETEETREIASELKKQISKPENEIATEDGETAVAIRINEIFEQTHEQRLDQNLAEQNRLLALLPLEKELKDAAQRERDRRRGIENQIASLERLKASSGWQFAVIEEPTPATPHLRTNKKKLFVGAYGLLAIALASPCLFWEMYRHRRAAKTVSPSVAERLGLVPLADVDLASYETVHPAMINGCLPDENSRRVAHVLRQVIGDRQYSLALFSLGSGAPPLSWVLGMAKCFSRWNLRVLVLEVGSPTSDASTPTIQATLKPRPRTTRTRSQVAKTSAISIKTKYRGTVDRGVDDLAASVDGSDSPSQARPSAIEEDRRSFRTIAPNVDYQSVSRYEDVSEVIERRGGDYALVLAVAGIDARAALNAETLALDCDGVVFCEIASGEEDETVVEVISNIVRCNANVLGVVQPPREQEGGSA